jgi:hypothetical protein
MRLGFARMALTMDMTFTVTCKLLAGVPDDQAVENRLHAGIFIGIRAENLAESAEIVRVPDQQTLYGIETRSDGKVYGFARGSERKCDLFSRLTWDEALAAISSYINPPVQAAASFEQELEGLINRHSQENGSNTPDFILASYLVGCLKTWNEAVTVREKWYGRSTTSPATVAQQDRKERR